MLADQDGVYDPTDYNDRLLLGLRGIMNEAELHILRGRMHQALLSKAKRGEIYIHAPIGYVKLPTGEFGLDPDEQVQAVVRMIFEELDCRGSARSVLKFFQANDIKLPIRARSGVNKNQIEWRTATPSVINRVLTHELYAGMYRFGHRQTDPRRKIPGRPDAGRSVVTPDKYHALIRDHCPAYISEERYRRNQHRIRDNRFGGTSKGAPRTGESLLAGILYCGKCGRRMSVSYSGANSVMQYSCTTGLIDFRSAPCQSLSGKQLDELVAAKVLKALEPASLEVSILAAADIEQAQQRLHDNWRQRLERSQFSADRARRQYDLVEPDNRLVARELEQQWNTALQEAETLKQEYARFLQTHVTELSNDQRAMIQSLAGNVPALWQLPTTTNSDRQRIVRILVERVDVVIEGATEQVDVALQWSGGFTSHHGHRRAVRRYGQTADYERLKTRIVALVTAGNSYTEIASVLNKEGFHPTKQTDRFNKSIVGRLAKKFRVETGATRQLVPIQLKPREWTVKALSTKLQIPQTTLHSWKQRGWLHVARQLPGYRGQLIYWADETELIRLGQLRQTKWSYGDPPLPSELTTPKFKEQANS